MLGGLLFAISLAGAAVMASWWVASDPSRWLALSAAVLWGFSAISAFHFWHSQRIGKLRWDGQRWALSDSLRSSGDFMVLSGAPEVLLDLQSHLWVKVVPVTASRQWCWLERATQPDRWMDLRRAVYSRAKPGVDRTDESASVDSRGA